MSRKLLLLTVFVLFISMLKAQSVSVSDDGKKISYIITPKSTKAEIIKAENVFRKHNITAAIDPSWNAGKIQKLSISVHCDKGDSTYSTDNVDVIKKVFLLLLIDLKKQKLLYVLGNVNNA